MLSLRRNDAARKRSRHEARGAATALAASVERSASRAIRYAGSAADVISTAFRMCARSRKAGTRSCSATRESATG